MLKHFSSELQPKFEIRLLFWNHMTSSPWYWRFGSLVVPLVTASFYTCCITSIWCTYLNCKQYNIPIIKDFCISSSLRDREGSHKQGSKLLWGYYLCCYGANCPITAENSA